MSAELPPDILVIESDGATRYYLRRPALGLARLMSGALAAFGLAPIAMGFWTLREISGNVNRADGPFAIGTILPLLCPSSLVLIGGLISLLGVWLLAGHAEIVLTAGEISSAFRLGPLAWRGRRERRQVRRLLVERWSHGPNPGADLASLYAETDVGRPLALAFVYSSDWLVPLAADLARRWDTGEGPLPVIERATGHATSRRWRRTLPTDGTRQALGWALFVWGGMFFALGVLCFVMMLQALLRGDPGNGLQGAYPWKWLWILFPFPFIVPGALALLYAFRRRKTAGLSPEQLKAVEAKAPAPWEGTGGIAPTRTTPETDFPAVPAVSHAPGAELSVRLTQAAPGCGVAILLGLVLLCSGILAPLAAYAINQARAGHLDGGTVTAGIFALLLGLFWLKLTGVLVKGVRLWRMGQPVVEVSALPLYCGESCEVIVTVHGPLILSRLRAAVLCEEEVSYADGEDRQKDTCRVHDQELASRENLVIERDDPFRVRGVIHVPLSAMHSFKAEHNEVRWVVRVEGDVQRPFRLPFAHDYKLTVRPRREHGGKT